MTHAYKAIDKLHRDISQDYAGHQASGPELAAVKGALHAYRAAASHLFDAGRLTRAPHHLEAAANALLALATEEAQGFRRRHPLGRRAA